MNDIARKKLNDDEIVRRYRAIYGLGDTIDISHARKHWAVERRLTDELLATTPENRWAVFSRAYTQLYSELPWLNQEEDSDKSQTLEQWGRIISPGSRVFEIGSGKAELLKYLSRSGCICTATEITRERGERHAKDDHGLSWHLTDGINLAKFEPEQHYDVVISTGVLEHLHPDDIVAHFTHALKILRPGGRYILTTPHIASGPHDLSKVFGEDKAVCMHLREFDYPSLGDILKQVGFQSVSAVFPPSKIFQKIGWTTESRAYFFWLRTLDICESIIPSRPDTRRLIRSAMKLALMPDNIWLSARAPHSAP